MLVVAHWIWVGVEHTIDSVLDVDILTLTATYWIG